MMPIQEQLAASDVIRVYGVCVRVLRVQVD